LETKTTGYFNTIISEVIDFFSDVEYTGDYTPQRAILRINATYKDHRVFISELISPDYRKYTFYILKDNYVVAGFDNSQDIRAIKLKFKKPPDNDIDRLIPHLHLKNKTVLELTDEITLTDFINWIKVNIL